MANDGLDREFLFSKLRLYRVPRNLRGARPVQIKERFNELFQDQEFTQWWDQTCGGASKDDKFVWLRFPHESLIPAYFTSPWDVPWELLVERLGITEAQATVSLVRTLDLESRVAPSVFDEPMRILILQGDDGRTINRPLNLELETRQIEEAWQSLDFGGRQCIDQPRAIKARQDDLSQQLSDYEPHVIWFSGHGRAKPDSSLLFADGQWVSARDFAKLIANAQRSKGTRPPLYAVFWACDTGGAEVIADATPLAPTFFEELTKVGVLSVLAMQSPIRDVSALSMAQCLIEFLGAGFPLERAVARARGRLLDDLPDYAHELDWATPVVWSAAEPVERLTWNSKSPSFAQFQLLGRQAMRWRRSKPSELDGPPSSDELTRAHTWVSSPRTWVQGKNKDAEIQHHWVRTLQAIQVETGRLVIAVDLLSNETDLALQEWAQNIHSRMLPGDFADEFALILKQISHSPPSGWKRLCELKNICVAIAQPPKYDQGSADSWFWEPLRVGGGDDDLRVVVLSDQPISEEVNNDWIVDGLGSEMDSTSITAAVGEAPRLALAMAVLNMPLRSYLVSVESANEGAKSLAEWQAGAKVMIQTHAGPLMTATARHHLLDKPDPALLKQAHRDCANMLDQPQVRRTTAVLKELLEHFLGADLRQEAVDVAADLCFDYKAQDRPAAVLQLVKQIGSLWEVLPQHARLIPAWAYLQLGKLDHSRLFLLRATAFSSPLDEAWKHGLKAELSKSEGVHFSKENALEEIDAAIEICATAQPDAANPPELIARRLRAYRQDRARILQFLFYKKEEAAAEYAKLIEEWSDQPQAVIDLAVVKRNYSECLRSLSTGPTDPRWQQAQDLLQEAELLVKNRPELPILAEILYEKAKAAEAAGKLSELRELLQDCVRAALKSQHYMVRAVAQNKLFWVFETFSLARWAQVKTDLEGFPLHGWAVRTLVDGKLRAARHLEILADFEGAFAELESARGDLERNPSFNMGGDKLRIARTMAGLQIVGLRLGRDDFWTAFTQKYDWANDWLHDSAANTPEAIWSEVK